MNLANWFKHPHEPFIYAALTVALTAGFGYGAFMVGTLAMGLIPGTWWGALVQAHGHAQLFGWMGLFILGMGLYFLPRLRGVPLQSATRMPLAFGLLGAGIGLRVLAQPLLAWNVFGATALPFWQILWLVSAALELAGIFVLGSMLVTSHRAAKPLIPTSPAYPIEPFLRIAVLSFSLAFLLNGLGIGYAVAQGKSTLATPFENLIITLMFYGVAVPMAIVFGTRTLPLFMRLAPPPRESLRLLARVYSVGLLLVLLPSLVPLTAMLFPSTLFQNRVAEISAALNLLWGIGSLALNLCILIFLWQLDLLRRRSSWVANRAANTRPELDVLRKPTRANYPDSGEYGRFELLIYAAFAWLGLTVVLNLARVLGEFTDWFRVSPDTARHALAVGFVTLLICGMAARMVPGFSHKKGLAYPQLVAVIFVVGNLAALLRVIPTLFPNSEIALTLWGLSGIFGWMTIALLAFNLVTTIRSNPAESPLPLSNLLHRG